MRWKTLENTKKHVETTNWLTHSPLIQVFGSLSWYVKHCKTQVSLYVVLTFPGSTDFYSSIHEPSAMLCPTRGLVILVPNSERCLTCQRLDRLPNINRLVYRCLWDSLRLEPRCLLWKTGCCPKLSQGQYGLEGPLAVKRKYADCTSHCPAGMRWQCVDKIEMRTSTLKTKCNHVQPVRNGRDMLRATDSTCGHISKCDVGQFHRRQSHRIISTYWWLHKDAQGYVLFGFVCKSGTPKCNCSSSDFPLNIH